MTILHRPKRFALKTIVDGKLLTNLAPHQLWPGTEIQEWGRKAEKGERYPFNNRLFIERTQ